MQQDLFEERTEAQQPAANPLEIFETSGLEEPVDRALRAFFCRKGATDEMLLLAVSLLSAAGRMGHTTLRLRDLNADADALFSRPGREVSGLGVLRLDAGRLAESTFVHVQRGDERPERPLVLDGDRLYFNRYFCFELETAQRLLSLAEAEQTQDSTEARDSAESAKLLKLVFGEEESALWQRVAGAAALNRRLSVLTGGPGTGKTYTVQRLLLLLLHRADTEGRRLRVAISAPTGKAANRVRESLIAGIEDLRNPKLMAAFPELESLIAQIPVQAMTLHRLLGVLYQHATFRHRRDNPLPHDLVIVDEASMVPAALMARLLEALRPEARLILLGDKHQLASVESGAVFADICHEPELNRFSADFANRAAKLGVVLPTEAVAAPDEAVPPLRDCIVELTHSRRFSAESGIGQLARAINAGDADAAITLLQSGRDDVQLLPPRVRDWLPQVLPELESQLAVYRSPGAQPEHCLDVMKHFQILCAHRRGGGGTQEVIPRIEQALGLPHESGFWYAGRPVIMTRNDYQLGLYNGDLGITLTLADETEQAGEAEGAARSPLRVAMEAFDPVKSAPYVALRTPAQLQEMETCWALTVHKSQGSEYGKVLLALPEQDSPVLTRELLYTAVTRAKGSILIAGSEALIRAAIARRTQRFSGLGDRLGAGNLTSP